MLVVVAVTTGEISIMFLGPFSALRLGRIVTCFVDKKGVFQRNKTLITDMLLTKNQSGTDIGKILKIRGFEDSRRSVQIYRDQVEYVWHTLIAISAHHMMQNKLFID